MWPFKEIDSFAVETQDGGYLFFEANRARIRRDGRLEFRTGWWTLEGAIQSGEWVWWEKGLTRDALRRRNESVASS